MDLPQNGAAGRTKVHSVTLHGSSGDPTGPLGLDLGSTGVKRHLRRQQVLKQLEVGQQRQHHQGRRRRRRHQEHELTSRELLRFFLDS